MKKFVKKLKSGWNKVIQIIKVHKGVSIGICCVIAVIGVFLIFGGKAKTEEQKIANSLETLGRDWYDNYFYEAAATVQADGVDTREDFLQRFTETGIKVNLNNLELHVDDETEMEIFEKNNCDKEETKIIIYPQKPYGVGDYKIETVLKCSKDNGGKKE